MPRLSAKGVVIGLTLMPIHPQTLLPFCCCCRTTLALRAPPPMSKAAPPARTARAATAATTTFLVRAGTAASAFGAHRTMLLPHPPCGGRRAPLLPGTAARRLGWDTMAGGRDRDRRCGGSLPDHCPPPLRRARR